MIQTNRRSKKVRRGDHVLAIAGNDKGRHGVVLSCNGDKVVVQGLNMRKKHVKQSNIAIRTGIIDIECPIHISNVRLCTPQGAPLKLKVQTNSEGERELCYMKDGEPTLYRSIKKSH